MRGFTVLEVIFAASILAVVAAIAIPQTLAGITRIRTVTAARYLAQQCGVARFRAVGRGRTVALRFTREGDDYTAQAFADGDGNGVRTVDINAGIDRPVSAAEQLSALFPRARIALDPALGLGDDPIRLSGTDLLSFTPLGTATAGTIYVLGADGTQLAVRVLGVTGRARVLYYQRATGAWDPL
jgi:prepilin-type N-terminal cleavage/methylation domain-containing protein